MWRTNPSIDWAASRDVTHLCWRSMKPFQASESRQLGTVTNGVFSFSIFIILYWRNTIAETGSSTKSREIRRSITPPQSPPQINLMIKEENTSRQGNPIVLSPPRTWLAYYLGGKRSCLDLVYVYSWKLVWRSSLSRRFHRLQSPGRTSRGSISPWWPPQCQHD